MVVAERIDRVLKRIETIIRESYRDGSRIGYFAALYYRVTTTIKGRLGTGFFYDDDRLQRLDEAFAGRYFSALEAWRSGSPELLGSWRVAFEATRDSNLSTLQHLLAGVNPHMNVDLGAACVDIASGEAIDTLKCDFNHINELLTTIVPVVREELEEESWIIKTASTLFSFLEDEALDEGIFLARGSSWRFALKLAQEDEEARASSIKARDEVVEGIGHKLVDPSLLSRVLNTLSRDDDGADVRRIIRLLTPDELELEA